MIYEPDHVVLDFAKRTQHNLAVVRKLSASGEEVYEVTQFINSLLGLLIFPKEEFFQVTPTTPLARLASEGWTIPLAGYGNPAPRDLRDFIRLLRNAVTHFHIEFMSTTPSDSTVPIILGVRLWNERGRQRIWQTTLTLDQLERVTEQLLGMIIRLNEENAT